MPIVSITLILKALYNVVTFYFMLPHLSSGLSGRSLVQSGTLIFIRGESSGREKIGDVEGYNPLQFHYITPFISEVFHFLNSLGLLGRERKGCFVCCVLCFDFLNRPGETKAKKQVSQGKPRRPSTISRPRPGSFYGELWGPDSGIYAPLRQAEQTTAAKVSPDALCLPPTACYNVAPLQQ